MEKKTSVKELLIKKEYRKAVIVLTGNLEHEICVGILKICR